MRKGHISLLLCDFAYIMTFLRFQGEPSDFTSKYGILGGSWRRVEVRGSPKHQEQAGALKIGNARPCAKRTKSAGHQRSGTAVPPRTGGRAPHARPCMGRCRAHKWLFAISFGDTFFHSAFFFLVFPLAFRVRERLERVLKHLD